jgi:hypothetical protein
MFFWTKYYEIGNIRDITDNCRELKAGDQAMKCDRRSENCCKEAKFQIDVYNVKRVKKGSFIRYERKGRLSKLFLCEDHAGPFHQDKVNYEIIELKT